MTAVVAVAPYRSPVPPVLPAPDDPWGRAVALRSVPIRRAVGVGDIPGGVAVLDPDVAHSRDNNKLVLTEAVDAARWGRGRRGGRERRMAAPGGRAPWPDAGPDGVGAAGRGWNTEELILMARSPASCRAGTSPRSSTNERCTPSGSGPGAGTWRAPGTSTAWSDSSWGASISTTAWCVCSTSSSARRGGSWPPASCG